MKSIGLLAIIILLLVMPDYYVLSEIVILKDGGKYIGTIIDEGDKIKITTQDGEITVKKERIKAIYKDATTIIKEITNILTETKTLIYSVTHTVLCNPLFKPSPAHHFPKICFL